MLNKTSKWLVPVAVLLLVVGFSLSASGTQEKAEAPASAAEKAGAADPAVGNGKWWATLTQYENETGKTIAKFNESPMLAVKVQRGELAPVGDRLPKEPGVAQPFDTVGRYSSRPLRMTNVGNRGGGFWHVTGQGDFCHTLGRWNRAITEIEPEKITMDVDFIEGLGMDSMMALEVLAALEKKYKIRIPEEKLMKLTNLNEAIKLTKEYLNAK